MTDVLDWSECFIKCNQVVPIIRKKDITNDIYSYFDMRYHETNSMLNSTLNNNKPVYSEVAQSNHKAIAQRLDSFGTVYYQGSMSTKAKYQYLWNKDLKNSVEQNSLKI